jgi:hypothetical protein
MTAVSDTAAQAAIGAAARELRLPTVRDQAAWLAAGNRSVDRDEDQGVTLSSAGSQTGSQRGQA